MVFVNYTTMQMTAKIVYYGPGLCGKTTNLQWIHGKTAPRSRGEMVSLETDTDRTLFFDLLPLDVGVIGGMKLRLQLYTVPGQVFYNATRRLVLKGVDGVVFVADSQVPALEPNQESLANLKQNLEELGEGGPGLPIVYQYNKRDLRNILAVDKLDKALNPAGAPSLEAAAIHGLGVFETLKDITRLALDSVRERIADDRPSGEITVASVAPRDTEAEPEGKPKAEAEKKKEAEAKTGSAGASPEKKGKKGKKGKKAKPDDAEAGAKATSEGGSDTKSQAKTEAKSEAKPKSSEEKLETRAKAEDAPAPQDQEEASPSDPASLEPLAVEFAEEDTDKVKVRAVSTQGSRDIGVELRKLREMTLDTPTRPPTAVRDRKNSDDTPPPGTDSRQEIERKTVLEVPPHLLRGLTDLRIHLGFDRDGREEVVRDAVRLTLVGTRKLEDLKVRLDLDLTSKD